MSYEEPGDAIALTGDGIAVTRDDLGVTEDALTVTGDRISLPGDAIDERRRVALRVRLRRIYLASARLTWPEAPAPSAAGVVAEGYQQDAPNGAQIHNSPPTGVGIALT